MLLLLLLPLLTVLLKAVCVVGVPAHNPARNGDACSLAVTKAVTEAVTENLEHTPSHASLENTTLTPPIPATRAPPTPAHNFKLRLQKQRRNTTMDNGFYSRPEAAAVLPVEELGVLLLDITEATLEQLVKAQEEGQTAIPARVIQYLPGRLWAFLQMPVIDFITGDFWDSQMTQDFLLELTYSLEDLRSELEYLSLLASTSPDADTSTRQRRSLDFMTYIFGTSENALRILNTLLYYLQTLVW